MPCPIGERIVPAMAADGADGATTVMAVGATRTTGPVVGAGAAAAAVEIVKKEVGEGAPLHRIIGTI